MTREAIRWLWLRRHDDPFLRLLLRRELRALAAQRSRADARWEWRRKKK